MFETLRTRIAQWNKYKMTLAELSSMNNRQLADIGIARGDIQRLAREASRS